MKINYKGKEIEKEIATAGDLIKIEVYTGIVINDPENSLTVCLLTKYNVDCFELLYKLKSSFEDGEYKIIAKSDEWEINISKEKK